MKFFCLYMDHFSPISWGIRFISGGPIVHTGLIFEDKLYQAYDASESRGNVNWGKDVRDYAHRKIWIYDVPDPEMKGYNYAWSQKGAGYDWGGIAGYRLHLDDRRKLFCSELTIETLIRIYQLSDSRTSIPEEFLGSKRWDPNTQKYVLDQMCINKVGGIVKIYEGKSKDYRRV